MYKNLVSDVFFDLDHTLWDFERNSALTFEKILSQHSIKVGLSEFLDVYVPINFKFWKLYREEKITKSELRYQRLRSVFDTLGHEISDDTIHRLSEEYIAHLSSFGHLFPDTIEILNYLRPKYKLHIITNGFREVQKKKLVNAKIHSFFDHVVDSEMAGVKKPDPFIFELAMKKARVSPENSIMIGDNLEADIFGAQALGMKTLHFMVNDEPPHNHCPIIGHLQEIKTYL
ncbi:YjjG family noncanonical pyrimidine nucleotidase [Maribacter sp. 2304DJ31-5]|uniref:YjjG family noncanonical pyrimidine nucleotidase n=1 Tax=Maribacter sp. 2304DJ31-5 TaxID=3386273 RepID=UPI0039BD06D3